MNYPDTRPTWGLRYWEGYFHVHLMWMHWRTGHWLANRTVAHQRYKTLERALKAFEEVDGAVMIFPV